MPMPLVVMLRLISAPMASTVPGCSSYFSGPVGEYIRYNKVLTATERLRVNTYLS